MILEEKAELAGLLEEKMFRSEQGIQFEPATHTDINGVEHTIFFVRLKLRPPHIMAKIGQR